MDKLSFLRKPIQLMGQGLQQLQSAMSQSGEAPVVQPSAMAKQRPDIGSHILGIGSTVLEGSRGSRPRLSP
jgi:hypothetical protein